MRFFTACVFGCLYVFVASMPEDSAMEKPRIQPFSFPIKHRLGKDITVSCFAMEGQPPLKFSWAKDGTEISNGAKFTVEQATAKISTLTIHGVSAADIGNYTCGVSNNEGSDTFSAALLVTGAYNIAALFYSRTEKSARSAHDGQT